MDASLVIPGALVSLVVGVTGWLLARAIKSVDDKLIHLDGKVDHLGAKDGEHDRLLVELGVRLNMMEKDQANLRSWRDDISGFFQTQGFRKRDG